MIKKVKISDLMDYQWKNFDFSNPDLFINKFSYRLSDYGSIYGEFESFNDPNIGCSNASHKVYNIYYDNYCLYAEIFILDNKFGKLLKSKIDDDNYEWCLKMKTKWNTNERFTITEIYTVDLNKKKKIIE